MRLKDLGAIIFCVIVISGVFLIAYWLLPQPIYTVPVTAVLALWLLTRARMIRIYRRLRGQTRSRWDNFYQN